MKRRIIKYYIDGQGRPLFCVLVIVEEHCLDTEGGNINVCSVSFTMPYFYYKDYKDINVVVENIRNMLEENPDHNIDTIDPLLEEVGDEIKKEASLRLLYLPDFLISEDNKVLWNNFNILSKGEETQDEWLQLVFNLDAVIGKLSVYTSTFNEYMYRVATYYLEIMGPELNLDFVKSGLQNFICELTPALTDVVLDNYTKGDQCVETFYDSGRGTGKMFLLKSKFNKIKLFCCIDD